MDLCFKIQTLHGKHGHNTNCGSAIALLNEFQSPNLSLSFSQHTHLQNCNNISLLQRSVVKII